jgi:hypothetical protein
LERDRRRRSDRLRRADLHGRRFRTVQGVSIPVAASVATSDTALLGFGIESLATPTAQAEVLGRVLEQLLQ